MTYRVLKKIIGKYPIFLLNTSACFPSLNLSPFFVPVSFLRRYNISRKPQGKLELRSSVWAQSDQAGIQHTTNGAGERTYLLKG